MHYYDISPRVEAFSTNIGDSLDFRVVLPQHQAHGTRSVIIDAYDSAVDTNGVDAVITCTPGVRIGVKTADCVPVLIYDESTSAVAAIHSGWKGTLANIVGSVIERMRSECAAEPSAMRAVIGPCIHAEAFEVGDELYDKFLAGGYGAFCRRMPRFGTDTNEQWHIDLPAICAAQLAACGVGELSVSPVCTYTKHHAFYSARRLGPDFASQRIINAIMLR